MEKKRLTAYKTRIMDLTNGKYVIQEGFNPNYVLTSYGQKLSRIRILATVMNTFTSNDGRYAFVVLDDGTGTIRSKAFQDVKIIEKLKIGDLVDFIGKIREYEGERYILPELVKKVRDANMETLRKLEIMKSLKEWNNKKKIVFENKGKFKDVEELKKELSDKYDISGEDVESILETEDVKEEKIEKEKEVVDGKAAREIVLKTVGELDEGEGVDYSKIIEKAGLPEPTTESAINELLSEGSCYEPRAGKIKVL